MTTFALYGSVFCLAALIVLVRQIFRRARARREKRMREDAEYAQRMVDYSEMPAPRDEGKGNWASFS